MDRRASNYGIQRDYPAPYGPPPRAVPTKEDRLWATLAHLSTFLMLLSVGVLGPVGAFAIWLFKRGDSPMVAHHALRSMVYQVVWLVVIAVGWTVTAALTPVLIGFLLWPPMVVITAAPFVHATLAAVRAWHDHKVYV